MKYEPFALSAWSRIDPRQKEMRKSRRSLDVEVLHIQRVVFDELAARFDVLAH
jgi:hypothetical protein